jgi:hypothetical protein
MQPASNPGTAVLLSGTGPFCTEFELPNANSGVSICSNGEMKLGAGMSGAAAQQPMGFLDPMWQTLVALWDLTLTAEAGTALFAFALVILSLEFLRESKGFLVPLARVAVVGSLLFTGAYFVYGDFLALPAKGAFARFTAELPAAASNTLLITSLGAAGAGLTFYAGTRSGAAAAMRKAKHGATFAMRRIAHAAHVNRPLLVSDLGRGLSLDLAGRLQLRAMTRNPKKPLSRAAKPAYGAKSSMGRLHG